MVRKQAGHRYSGSTRCPWVLCCVQYSLWDPTGGWWFFCPVSCTSLHKNDSYIVFPFSSFIKKLSSLNDLIRIFWVRRNKAKSFIISSTDFDSLSFTAAISESADSQIKQLQNKMKTTNTLKVELRVPSLTFSVSYMYKMCGVSYFPPPHIWTIHCVDFWVLNFH